MVLKRALADRVVLAAAFFVVLFGATLVAAIPIYVNAVGQSGLRERLARAPVTEANLEATAPASGGEEAALDSQVTELTQAALAPVGGAPVYRSGESEPFNAAGRVVVFGFFDGIPNHASLVAGRWPRDGEVVVSGPAAAALRLHIGDTVDAQSRLAGGPHVSARVAGIYRVDHPSSAYWWEEPLATTGADAGEFGPLVTTRRSFLSLGLQGAELRWRLEPSFHGLTTGQGEDLRHALQRLPGRLNQGRSAGEQVSVETGLPGILAAASHSLHAARAGVLVPSIQVALLALYGLLFTTALLLERRLVATESLRLRGASTGQIVRMAFVEAALISIPAVLVAPWLAAAGLHILNWVGPLADIGLQLDPKVTASAYALAAAAGAVCIGGLTLPALRARGVVIARDRRRLDVAGLAQRMRLDLILVALALIGYWQLRRYHGVLVDNRAGLGIDPFLVAAPALLLLAGALLSQRLVPLFASFVERLIGGTRGVVAALGFRQVARRPRGYSRSILLLVLAVAIGVFAATYSETWHRSQVDQAAYAAGADVLVDPSERGGAPSTIDLGSSYRALGATAALPAVTDSFDFAAAGGATGNLLALDTRRAPGVVRPRGDFSSRSFDDLVRPLADGRGRLASVALPGRPARLALTVALTIPPSTIEPSQGTGPYIANPSVFLYLQDGDGLLYLYRLQGIAQGASKRFVLDLAHPLPSGPPALPRYPLSVVGLELDLNVPPLASRRSTLDLRSLEVAGPKGSWRTVPIGHAARWRAYSSGFPLPLDPPAAHALTPTPGSVRTLIDTGSFVFNVGQIFSRSPSAAFFLRPGKDELPKTPPAIVSESFLEGSNTEVGQVVPLSLTGGTHRVRIVGTFKRFPTLDPATPAVIVDLPTYLDFSLTDDGHVVEPSTWWLRTGGDSTAIAHRLRAAPYRSIDVVSRAEGEHTLLEDAVPLGVIGALALGFAAAAAFAAVGFGASATAAARQRTLEFAVLRSLGLGRRQLSGGIGIETGVVVVLSLAGGTALGLLVSGLVLPYVALGASGAAPVPPVQLAIPWQTILWLELALVVALAAIAAFQLRMVNRLRLAPALRRGEEAIS
ncbi:MAG TPA: FtsX-like permease family protein [Gaiellaceae bacterium]|nr:FtsX-like permease family protein [Gaiellaceae bacterium]